MNSFNTIRIVGYFPLVQIFLSRMTSHLRKIILGCCVKFNGGSLLHVTLVEFGGSVKCNKLR